MIAELFTIHQYTQKQHTQKHTERDAPNIKRKTCFLAILGVYLTWWDLF